MLTVLVSEVTEAARNSYSTGDLLRIIGRRGMTDILYCLESEPKRFSQIMFETRLNPSILDRHLKVLIKLGLVVKEDNLYRLTESGTKVIESIEELTHVFRKVEE